MARPPHYQEALLAATTQVGLDPRGAVILHIRGNVVYYLPREGAVARLRPAQGPLDEVLERFTAAIQVTRWLRAHGFPTTEPLDLRQPVIVPGHVATFWRYVTVTGGERRDVTALGQLVRRLHELPPPPVALPAADPLGSLRTDAEHSGAITPQEREWLLARADELERRFPHERWALGRGLVHGDAHVGNLLYAPDGAVLCDWDSVSYGPREMDLLPTSMWRRYGRPRAEWERFCAAYHVNPDELPGLPLLQQLRELQALAAYIRNGGDPAFRTELTRRLTSLQSGDQETPWRAL
jgi:Phosphotransferase enzyme family